MKKIKNAIPVGAEIYELEIIDGSKTKIYYKDHFSDAYNSSFKKATTVDEVYDLDVISNELIGYTRPTKDYLERPKKIQKLIPFDTLEGAIEYLKCFKLLGKNQKTTELIENNFKAQKIILNEGTFKDKFTYIIYDYISIEIMNDRMYVNNQENKLINGDITVESFLIDMEMFDKKVKVYNKLCEENGFMRFPLYWIKNPIVKSIIKKE